MGDIANSVEVPSSSKVTKKGKASNKTLHPTTAVMVNSAIEHLKERGGSSLQAIKKYIASTYKIDVKKLSPFIKKYITNAVKSGSLIQTKGKGASGSFKLASAAVTKSSKTAKTTDKKPALKPKVKPAKKKTASPKKKTTKTAKVTKQASKENQTSVEKPVPAKVTKATREKKQTALEKKKAMAKVAKPKSPRVAKVAKPKTVEAKTKATKKTTPKKKTVAKKK